MGCVALLKSDHHSWISTTLMPSDWTKTTTVAEKFRLVNGKNAEGKPGQKQTNSMEVATATMDEDMATRERDLACLGESTRAAKKMIVMFLKMAEEQRITMENHLTHFSREDPSAAATRIIDVRKRLVEDVEHVIRVARLFSAQNDAFAAYGYTWTTGTVTHRHDGVLGATTDVTTTEFTSAMATLRTITDTIINKSTARLTAIDSFIARTLKADLDRVMLSSRSAFAEDNVNADADQLHLPE